MNNSSTALHNLSELFFSLLHFIQRPIVQSQVIAFLIAIIIAFYLARILWQKVGVPFKLWVSKTEKSYFWQRLVRFFERMLFPILGLLSLRLASQLFRNISDSVNLLDICISYFWVFAAYRLLIALLYSFFHHDIIKQFHRPIIAPLFVVWIFLDFLKTIVNIDSLGQSEAINLFGNSLRVDTLVGTAWLLYLCVILTTALRESILVFIQHYTSRDQGLAEAWLSILSYISYISAFIVFLNQLGIDQNTIAFITGGLSVGLGFGLRAIIANFFSGIILLFERSLRPGDILEIEGKPVVVSQLHIRTTRVESYEGQEIIVPNETIFTSNLHTFTGNSNVVRCDINVGIHYRHDPHEVKEHLLEIAKRHIDVLQKPAPYCLITEFASSSIDLSLRVWVAHYTLKGSVKSELRATIWKEFKEANIELPFPQQDIHFPNSTTPPPLSKETLRETIADTPLPTTIHDNSPIDINTQDGNVTTIDTSIESKNKNPNT